MAFCHSDIGHLYCALMFITLKPDIYKCYGRKQMDYVICLHIILPDILSSTLLGKA